VPLEVADDRAVAVALPPRPVVDADHPRRHGLASVAPRPHASQKRVLGSTGKRSLRAMPCPGRPPSAIPRQCTSCCSRVVRRAYGRVIPLSRRSAKIFRGHP
jgi:hypothetical protein